MVKLKELKPLGIAVNTGADGEATNVNERKKFLVGGRYVQIVNATAGIGGMGGNHPPLNKSGQSKYYV